MTKEYKQKTKTQLIAKRLGRRAFTLLELLLVIAIIAVLAGIIMFSLKPADRLREANQTKYLSNANDLEKAFNSYVVDNGGNLPTAFNSLTYGYYDICRQGQSGSCVSLDELVTNGKMSAIPVDSDKLTATTTGFKVKYDPTRKEAIVYSNSEYTSRINSGTTLTEGLVGWWKMDESSWGSVIDSSGNGNNGTAVNGATITTGKYGNGGSFDGVNDYVDIQNSNSLNINEGLTLSAWIYPKNINPNKQRIFDTAVSGITTGAQYSLKLGTVSPFTDISGFVIKQGVWYETRSNSGYVQLNTWQLVTYTYDSITGLGRIFINGNEVTYSIRQVVTGIDILTQNLNIGRLYYQGGSIFGDQLVDDARIYNRALNSDEILSLYNWSPPVTSDELMKWSLNENSGSVISDSSGNNYTSMIFNNPTWTTGKYGSGLNFDGNDYVGFNFSQTIPAMTISAWVNPSSYAGWRAIIQTATSGDRGLYLQNANLHFYSACSSTGTVPLNSWTYVTVTVDSANYVTYYINGVASGGCTSISNPRVIEYLNISGINTTDGENWVGKIDEVRIYNYVRTPAEIIEDMNGT